MGKLKGINAKFVGYQKDERPIESGDIVDIEFINNNVIDKSLCLDKGGTNEICASEINKALARAIYWDNWATPSTGLILDGVDDYVSILNNPNLNFGTEYTNEMFVYVDGIDNPYNTILFKGNTGAEYHSYISIESNGAIYVALKDDTGTSQSISTSAGLVSANNKYYIIVTVDADIKIYINKKLVHTVAKTLTGSFTNNADLIIGMQIIGFEFFKGKIYSVKSHNHALTQAEVLERFNNGDPLSFVEPYKYQNASQTDIANGKVFTSGWNSQSGVTINDGDTFTTSNSNTGIYTVNLNSFLLEIGKKYEITVSGSTTSDNFYVYTGIRSSLVGTGFGTFSFIADYEYLYIGNGSAGQTDITSLVVKTAGNVLNLPGNKMGANGLVGTMGGEPVIANVEGLPIAVAKTRDSRRITTVTSIMINSVKRGMILELIRIKNNELTDVTISLGTFASGTDVINEEVIPGGGVIVTFPLMKHFSDTEDTDLHFSSSGVSNYEAIFMMKEM